MNKTAFFKLARISALLAVFAIFSALTFEAFHKGHEGHCHEDDCPVCLVLQILHNTTKLSSAVSPLPVNTTAFFYIDIILLSVLVLTPATLVSQKIKLVI